MPLCLRPHKTRQSKCYKLLHFDSFMKPLPFCYLIRQHAPCKRQINWVCTLISISAISKKIKLHTHSSTWIHYILHIMCVLEHTKWNTLNATQHCGTSNDSRISPDIFALLLAHTALPSKLDGHFFALQTSVVFNYCRKQEIKTLRSSVLHRLSVWHYHIGGNIRI